MGSLLKWPYINGETVVLDQLPTYTLPKTNGWIPKMMGLGKPVAPFKNGHCWYLFVRFLGPWGFHSHAPFESLLALSFQGLEITCPASGSPRGEDVMRILTVLPMKPKGKTPWVFHKGIFFAQVFVNEA